MVTKRSSTTKRKSYEGRGDGLGNGTMKYVLGAAAVAGLAYLGSQSNGFKNLPAMPFSGLNPASQTSQAQQQETGGNPQPPVSVPPVGVSLFTGAYSGS